MNGLTVADIAWGAGLVEGEGYFSFNGPYRRTPMLGLGMTDRDVVEKFQKLFAPTNTIYTYAPPEGCKQAYSVKIVGKRAVGLMLTFFTFLGKRRRERIKELLATWKSARGSRKMEVTCE